MSNELTFFICALMFICFAGIMTFLACFGDYKEKKMKDK